MAVDLEVLWGNYQGFRGLGFPVSLEGKMLGEVLSVLAPWGNRHLDQ